MCRFLLPLSGLLACTIAVPVNLAVVTQMDFHFVHQDSAVLVNSNGSVILTSSIPQSVETVTTVLAVAPPSSTSLAVTSSTSSTTSTSISSTISSTSHTTPPPPPPPTSSPAPHVVTKLVSPASPPSTHAAVAAAAIKVGSGRPGSNNGASQQSQKPAPVQAASVGNSGNSCASASDPDGCNKALTQHNMYRKMHSADPLQWDNNLAALAASSMAGAPCSMQDYIDLGPNNGATGGHQSNAGGATWLDASFAAATDTWYSEGSKFSQSGYYNQDASVVPGGDYDSIGHFVNVIFKAHTTIGCAKHSCPGSAMQTNFLCLYGPYATNNPWPQNISPS